MAPALVVLVLALLLGLQPVTTDLYLPALPGLRAELGASMAQAQATLSALLLAFGASQLVWGPLSDRHGRRPILLWGMGIYVLASLASVLAADMAALIGARIVQGAAMGAAVMSARAIVRDLYPPVEGARMMSKGQTGLGLIACLCAPLGGLLSDWMGWRLALLAPALFAGALFALLLLRLRETAPPRAAASAAGAGALLADWSRILRHPTFWAFSLLSVATYGGLFIFLAASSFVLIQVLGLGKTAYGLLMASTSIVYIAGTFACRRLLPRLGLRRTVALASGLSLAGGTLMGLLALAGVQRAWALMLPFYLYILAHGIHQPCSQSGAVGPFARSAGTASALNGCLMMLGAFVTGQWLGTHMDGSVRPLAYGVWFWSGLIALIGWTLVQRHGHMEEH